MHGYANKLDMMQMANAVQMACCGTTAEVFFEFDPTRANVTRKGVVLTLQLPLGNKHLLLLLLLL